MRYIPIAMVQPGMCLAYDLFDSYGRTLVSGKSILSDSYIEKLAKLGIEGLYIDDDLSKDIIVEDVISPKLRTAGLSSVRERNVDMCKDVAKKIVDELLKKGTCSLDLADLRTFDDYTYAHSVNVAILSCVIGLGFQLSEEELINIVLAGLLHDMGKLEIPPEVLNKPSRLSQEEYMLMKTHSQLSYEFIKERIDISARVKQAVLYHHENVDGSGYPDGAVGESLSLITKIIHVADVYDALVSKRPYKQPYSPWEAVEFLMGHCNTMFDGSVVDTFIKYVPLYPKGSIITLSDGRQAIIVDNTGNHNLHPLVRLFDATNLDLSDEKYSDLSIILPPEEKGQSMADSEKEREQMLQALHRFSIVYIDESTANQELIQNRLSYLYDIVPLKSSLQFSIYKNKHDNPSIILIDVDMKEEDGYVATKKIVTLIGDSIPIIILSQNRDAAYVKKFRELHVTDYILKPYHMHYLNNELKKILFHENNDDEMDNI